LIKIKKEMAFEAIEIKQKKGIQEIRIP